MRVKLKDIFDLQMGKTPSRSNLEYWNTTDYKWISIADLSKTSKYIFETKEYLSKSAIKDSGIKAIPASTVVMSFKLSIGKTAITKEDMYSNEAIMAFKDKHVINILPEYIFYLFKYKNWEEGSNKAVMGKTLNKATLSEIEVEICSIEKQRQIVSILNKIMSVVDGRKQELQLLDALIKPDLSRCLVILRLIRIIGIKSIFRKLLVIRFQMVSLQKEMIMRMMGMYRLWALHILLIECIRSGKICQELMVRIKI